MKVTVFDLYCFVKANPTEPIYVTSNGPLATKHILSTGTEENLLLDCIPDEVYSVGVNGINVTVISFEQHEPFGRHRREFTLDQADITKVKQWTLNHGIAGELEQLYKPACRMVEHYNSTLTPQSSYLDQYRIDVYFLKDIDFHQEKGSVIIVPRHGRIHPDEERVREPNIIKGYVYNHHKDTINWETVQAWRYQYQVPDTNVIMNTSNMLHGWVSLMAPSTLGPHSSVCNKD